MKRQKLSIGSGLVAIAVLCGSDCVAENWSGYGGPSANFRYNESLPLQQNVPTKRWQQTLGRGMSGVVCDGNNLYTSYLEPLTAAEKDQDETNRPHREVVVALDSDTGNEIWRHEYLTGWIESQQAFGGRPRAPQATPAICGDRLVTIGFTGIIHCLDRKRGEPIWRIDAVAQLGAVPVQFGFAASPVVVGDRIVFLVGGKGGLVCLDGKTGQTIWNVACGEASYATPIHWMRPDGDQLVFVTRNRVVGVLTETGRQLWEYRLTEQGLTNVPTPMIVSNTGLLISGQGVKGTRRLEIVPSDNGEFEVSEAWKCDTQFFYCNWALHDGVLWGCDGKLLIAIDIASGERLGRYRGYVDANVISFRDGILVLDGKGNMSPLRTAENAMLAESRFALLDQRCWTPPTPVGDFLICRGGDQLLCVDLVGGEPGNEVAKTRIRRRTLSLSKATDQLESDAVDRILASFQSEGAEGAWKLYNSIRDADPEALPYGDRMNLAELAESEGLADFGKLIKVHAAEDFPQEAKEDQRPSC